MRQRHALIALSLVTLSFVCYANSLEATFLWSWDDSQYVTRNPLIQELSLASLWRICSQFYAFHYSPITWLSYAIDYHFWQLNPIGYHLGNVILHTCNAILVFMVGCRLQSNIYVAALAAALFVVHPLQVETVAWISERKNALSFFLMLLAFLLHMRSRSANSPRVLPWLSWGCYIGAVLSKPAVVCAPLLFIAYDVFWAASSWKRATLRHLPLLAIGALEALLTILAQEGNESLQQYWGGSAWRQALLMLRISWEYLVSILLPLRLDPFYQYTSDMARLSLPVYLGAATLLLTGVIAWVQPFGKPLSRFAMLWVWVFMLPVANILPFTIQRADRYLYFPSAMIFLLLGVACQKLWQRFASWRARGLILGCIGIALAALTGATLQQNTVWANSGTLWRHHLSHYPDSQIGALNLGVYYFQERDYARAYPLFHDLLKRSRPRLKIYRYAAQSALETERPTEAFDIYQAALAKWPNEKKLHNDLGYAYARSQRRQEALAAYVNALALDPAYELAQTNLHQLGSGALQQRELDLARQAFEALLRTAPRHPGALGGLCQTFFVLSDWPRAAQSCRQVTRTYPRSPSYWAMLAQSLLHLQQPADALKAAQQVVVIAPKTSLGHRLRGDAYRLLGQTQEAKAAYKTALAITPQDAQAQHGLRRLQAP